MKRMTVCFIVIIVLSILCIGFATASENESIPVIQPVKIPLTYNHSQDTDYGIYIDNVTDYLDYWNKRMDWGLSQKQMNDASIKLENQLRKNFTPINPKQYHIINLTQFNEELGSMFGLNNTQISMFIIENQKQVMIDNMNFIKDRPIPEKTEVFSSISSPNPGFSSISQVVPGSQSVPNASNITLKPQGTQVPGFNFVSAMLAILVSVFFVKKLLDVAGKEIHD
jgi:hypothetical protein